VIKTTKELKTAISKVVDYNWNDELRDYEAHKEDTSHIFLVLKSLDEWVNNN
jgi:hypothetical protein